MTEKPLVPYKSLKQKQKARIADWMYREMLRFFLEHQRMPEAEEFDALCFRCICIGQVAHSVPPDEMDWGNFAYKRNPVTEFRFHFA